MGSTSFPPTDEGYRRARLEIERILARGNRPGGDAGKVMAYFGYH